MDKTKQTAGAIYTQLQSQRQESITAFEMQEAMQEDYIPKLVAQVELDKKKIKGDLFIEVVTKRDPLMPKMVGNWFKSRLTCPTPNYDQSVFHYDRRKDSIEYLWTIPDLPMCKFLIRHALNLSELDKSLLKYVLDFRDGTLLQLAKHLNKETLNSDLNLIFSIKEDNGRRNTITS
jgi:hypothetical protein